MTSSSRRWTIVPDEWLVHDIWGDNGEERQQEAVEFLEYLMRQCDRFLLRRPSPFLDKAYRLMKDTRREFRKISKSLRLEVLYNSQKTIYVDESSPIPEELSEGVKQGDRYLVEALVTNSEAVLVSTDEALIECLRAKSLRACLRDKFLQAYLEAQKR